ncbi:MAG: hypothetical protein ACT4PI_06690 [Actinomycetota bacterium]
MRSALLVVVALALGAACDGGSDGGSSSSSESGDAGGGPCQLLTDDEVAELMGVEPIGPGAPEGDGCGWETDRIDPDGYFYVFVEIESLDDATEGYPDLRTAIDESTNVEIIDVEGLGDEAYATKSPLRATGEVDGIDVATGQYVLHIGFQPKEPVVRDTPRFDRLIEITERAIDRI